LVVGDGATGRQIALELAATHRVLLSTGRPRRVIPERVLGRSIFWWLGRRGLARAGRDSMVGRFLRGRDPFPGRRLGLGRLRAAGVVTKARLASMDGNLATFGDGSAEMIAAVVWATGYHDDTSWLVADGALDGQGQVLEWEGVSPVEGLYYIGRSWQRNRGSALLLGVGEDARLIVDRVSASLARRPAGKALSGAAVGPSGTGPPRRRVNYSLG
jgi:putative flavoprotein involved in K+ transport